MLRICIGAAVALTLAAGPASALAVCVEGAYPPFSEVGSDGKLTGFDIDIANALCAEIGEPCEMVQVPWERLIATCRRRLRRDRGVDVGHRRAAAAHDFTARYYRAPVRFVGPPRLP